MTEPHTLRRQLDESAVAVDGPSQWLSFRVAVLSNKLARRAAARVGAEHGLLLTEWRVIAVLGETGALAAADIAARTAIDKSWISRALTRLEGGGLVVRTRASGPRRRVDVALTAAGRGVYAAAAAGSRARNEELLAVLSAAERTFLFSLIERLDERADELDRMR